MIMKSMKSMKSMQPMKPLSPMTSPLRALAAPAAAALLLGGCFLGVEGPNDESVLDLPSPEGQAEDDGVDAGQIVLTGLEDAFKSAAEEFEVPIEILKGVGYAETQWQMVVGEEEFEGQPPAFGLMALRGDAIALGAEIAQVSEIEAKFDLRGNVRAGAALLSHLADELDVERDDLAAWGPVVAAYSGIDDADAVARYVHEEVYDAIRRGIVVESTSGDVAVSLNSIDVVPDFSLPIPAPQMAKGPDYGNSIWHPSPNYSSRPAGAAGKPSIVIIHTCEGGYSGCWGWLVNKNAGVSAHYVVKENGGEISQLVKEAHKAWHIGATYKCSLNGSKECARNGASSNNFTIGIEHAGFASQKSWQSGLIEASAKLVCNITKDQGILRDKYHIVAHGKLQPYNRTDPGANWPWSSYLSKVNGYCGQNQPPPEPQQPPPDPDPTTIVIDSNQANNNAAVAKITVSGNWTSSASTAGYYGSGYWFASTKAVSDGAEFSFYLPSAQKRTVDAWWTQGGNRAAKAPFVVFDAQGNKLGTVHMSQQTNGSKWVKVGEFNFTKGWNKVVLSRWTAEGSVVIGDAVRIR